ncbi:hypothetical protein BD410DRAFT_732945, partial [Rickenella mellea]
KLKMSVKDGLYESYKSNQVDDYFTIGASNRFFSRRDRITQATPLAFSTAVDPKRILSDAAGGSLVHLEDNVVRYYVKQHVIIGDEKICRFETADPSIFRPGQLVEMQVSFTLGQSLGKFAMFMVLRSIAMLSDERLVVSNCKIENGMNSPFKQEAELASSLEKRKPEGGLKRRIGYEDEEERDVVEARQSMAKLVISDLVTKRQL